MEEDQAAQHARVDKLWKALDTKQQGELDLEALKRGLATINHRKRLLNRLKIFAKDKVALKNADDLLQDVLNAVDTNKDGHISYSGM